MSRLGKWIDRAALFCAIGTGQFFYYRWATGKLLAALILTGISLLALWKVLARVFAYVAAKRGPSRRAKRQAAEDALSRFLYEPREAAESELAALLAAEYGETPTLCLLQRYPSDALLPADEVLSVWRANSGKKALVLTATRDFSKDAEALARKLENPKIALLGRSALRALCERHLSAEAKKSKRERPKIRFSLFVSRKKAPRQLLCGVLSLALYLIFGIRTQLVTGLVLLLLAGLGFRRPAPPARLFPQ